MISDEIDTFAVDYDASVTGMVNLILPLITIQSSSEKIDPDVLTHIKELYALYKTRQHIAKRMNNKIKSVAQRIKKLDKIPNISLLLKSKYMKNYETLLPKSLLNQIASSIVKQGLNKQRNSSSMVQVLPRFNSPPTSNPMSKYSTIYLCPKNPKRSRTSK